MMRALFSGVTGLRSHQTRMDVIGNNIANVNTIGFKKSSTTFADLYSETINPASGPTGNSGGVNANQIGLGVGVNAVVIQHTPGAAMYTGNVLDAAINGDGFFTVRIPSGELRYTRAGNFGVDSSGQLVVQGSGYIAQGFNSVYTQGTVGRGTVTGWDNKSTDNTTGLSYVTNSTVTDTTSGTYTFDYDENAGTLVLKRNGEIMPDQPAMSLKLKNTGVTPPTYTDVTLGAGNELNTLGETYSIWVDGYGSFEFQLKEDALNPGTAQTVPIDDWGTFLQEVGFTMENVTLTVKNNDYYAPGSTMSDIVIDNSLYDNLSIGTDGSIIVQMKESGIIPGTNIMAAKGEKVTLGFLAMAVFDNQQGLEKIGNNLYQSSPNSGQAVYTIAGEYGAGSLTPSSQEMSNVDLAEEMVNMITTQRGFQANSRIITTTDSMLEELVNLKR